jgi:hypothetical protein
MSYSKEMTPEMRERCEIYARIANCAYGPTFKPPITPSLRDAIYVDGENGDDMTGDGSLEKPFKTVTRAFDDRIEYEI